MADKDGAPGQEPNADTDPKTGEGAGDKTPDPKDGGDAGTPPAPKEDDVDSLPEWARRSITSANNEAANYRTQLREAQAKLEGAKTKEEVDAIIGEFSEKATKAQLDAARERAGRKYNLPDKIVAKLAGKTEDEILADAAEMAPLFAKQQTPPPPPPPPSGGRSPKDGTSDEESSDDAYKKAKGQQRFR